MGIRSQAKGKKGTWLVLAEWVFDEGECEWNVAQVKTVKIDGKKIKEDTLYELVDGKFTEVKENE